MKTSTKKAGKKKGAALILTLAVTSLLIVLAVSVMTAAFTSQWGTIGIDRSGQLKIIAQSGMEKSIAILREKIVQRVLADDNGIGGSNSILYTFAYEPTKETMSLLKLDPKTPLPDSETGEYSIYFNVFKNEAYSLKSDEQIPPAAGIGKKNGDCYVTFTDGGTAENVFKDPSDGIEKDCIKIKLLVYGRGESKRTETVYIEKNSISNYYLEKLFHNTLTALGDPTAMGSAPIRTSINPLIPEIEKLSKFQIGGNIYLQGDKLLLELGSAAEPALYGEIDGSIKVAAAETAKEVNFYKNLRFYRYNDDFTTREMTTANFTFPTDLKNMFSISGNFKSWKPEVASGTFKMAKSIGVQGTGKKVDQLLAADLFSNDGFTTVKGNDSDRDYALVAAKCIQDNSLKPVDFNRLVLGRDLDSHMGMRRLIAIKDLNLGEAGYQNEADFIKLFKVILVDGDLLIDSSKFYYDQINDNTLDTITASDFRKMRLMNYMIIASGTVTIRGTVEMYSSSIMAKNIVFEAATYDMPVVSETLEDGTATGNMIYDPARITDVLSKIDKLQKDRADPSVKETVHKVEIDPVTGMEYPSDPLTDEIKVGLNYSEDSLVTDGTDLAAAYEAGKTEKVQTTVVLSGIGTDDSVKEIAADMEEYDNLWSDARGYVTNAQKALINEYLIRNLSAEYAKQLKFKIISWEEK